MAMKLLIKSRNDWNLGQEILRIFAAMAGHSAKWQFMMGYIEYPTVPTEVCIEPKYDPAEIEELKVARMEAELEAMTDDCIEDSECEDNTTEEPDSPLVSEESMAVEARDTNTNALTFINVEFT
jgi:hypothetical protein